MSVATVAMKGCRPSQAISTPLTRPTAVPAAQRRNDGERGIGGGKQRERCAGHAEDRSGGQIYAAAENY